jgi:AhpD family alkylhydroperoxidase
MENMKKVAQQFQDSMERFDKEWPQQRQAFAALTEAAKAPGELEQKYKYLIALGISVAAHCHWCIAGNVKNALAHGATKKQVMEAGWVAVQMGGGPSLAYLQLVQQAVDDLAS